MKSEKEEVNGEEELELLEMPVSDVKRDFDAWKEKVKGFAEKYKRLGIYVDYEDGGVEVSWCDPDIDEAKYDILVFLEKTGIYIEFNSNIFEKAVKVAEFALDKRQDFLDRLPDIVRELEKLEIKADKEEEPPSDEASHRSTFEAYMRRDRETGHLFIHIYRGNASQHDLEIDLDLPWGVTHITFNEVALKDARDLMMKWVASDEELLKRLPRILRRYPLIWIVVANKEMQ